MHWAKLITMPHTRSNPQGDMMHNTPPCPLETHTNLHICEIQFFNLSFYSSTLKGREGELMEHLPTSTNLHTGSNRVTEGHTGSTRTTNGLEHKLEHSDVAKNSRNEGEQD